MLNPASVPDNQLLGKLSRRDRKRMIDGCDWVDLVLGTTLCERDQPLRHVYFPVTGFISMRANVGRHPPLEMGLVGSEGMLGVTLVLGVEASPLIGVVQGSGSAWRMPAARFRQQLRASPWLLRTLNRYLYATVAQLAQTAVCANFHEVEPRLARWLLMTHDRADDNRLQLTHALLADMLGVRRSSVSLAAGALQRRKLIRYSRGQIRVVSRTGLEAASCGCYDAMLSAYARALD